MTAPAARPPRPASGALRGVVVAAERISASMVRVVVGGDGMRDFAPSEHADSYVKLVFLPPSAGDARPLLDDGRVDLDAITATLAPGDQLRRRSYTVRAFDPATHQITLDLVVHGDEGLAGPWADRAAPGDEVLLLGPGGDYSPDPSADHHLLVGDASALPAIAVALERLAATAPAAQGTAVIEVHGPDDEIALTAPAGLSVRWVHQGIAVAGLGLVEAVRDLPWPAGRVHAFVHGEAGAVKELRHLLRVDRALSRELLSISGYWRLGADDEEWRAVKRDWNRSIEHDEQAAGLI
ncbi:siderophore-interacting protein [Cellulomonas sp. WB94]|uniref:siderophore-interacting protein n=1 Tax=Cellulomonas sp. WB94 TaxID=2173174 RepID=UPI001F5BFFED|nr:siderophore-interacting protein [Cellulomonas sp. WB94]